ncbi:MAG TPA: aldo/keto reductase [Gemmataceae bacterium]|jgi:diketogulonate reductase-like aldo/keto reductase|nr:aldo/keto reductase [Gemmataceae bacterium]
MSSRFLTIDNVRVPRFLYGTAWKEADTPRLTELALRQGFRGIDTANQRKHYDEAGVGQGIAASGVPRDELFLQTKFTFRPGQDNRLPYDPDAPVATQVEQSFASSQKHLGSNDIDSYVLHGPSRSAGLAAADWEAWRAMEMLHDRGLVRFLGVSNVNLDQLRALCASARVRPRFVQNRCYAVRGWDRQVREFCTANSIVYQGFSLLTANRQILASTAIRQLAKKYGRSAAEIAFRFTLDIGMLPLTGTTSADHMRADLDVFDFQLDASEIAMIERLGEG